MLINLSNHSSEIWDEKQLREASKYGDIIDVPFPAIDAGGDEEYIEQLAEEYLQKMEDIAKDDMSEATVHVMGEMTFTLSLVRKLQNVGITCIASTSQRFSTDLGNGQKTITFKFVRFRKYGK